ncbi:alpha-ketoacid dehydrogenase subunit beta [Brumicola nitratireducens]|uniref:2-oxoisovalerate dehydrogenase subunit beta n=1 Tax=Glaciecola nitratireducens (strain JCM 12485 / KCTC 12276 / FR1064) TaxID=1085623 RepID=G4QML2_GLANF|nr:alpha-ketoacid dehydrogenase subunit beta [Glaciecola nitratireducens]AEP30964.1 pyruvate dehydrogenase complex, E1 beta2 component [Glaciecola nitratireducens FR1064]
MNEQQLSYREALRLAIEEAMNADERVFLLGEDVGNYGGCYAVSKGLSETFGPDRIVDTPLSESGFVGAGIGAAIGGMRPIVEIMTVNFSLLALDQIVNNAATIRHMSGNQISIPIVIRMATGAGKQLAAQHSHSLENWYAHVPGIKVLAPATVADARYMLSMALKDPNPVIFFEHVMLYNESDINPAPEDCPDMHSALVRQSGEDISLVTYGGSLPKALEAARQLAQQDVSVEVIDLRSLRPLDTKTIFESVNKTHRLLVVDEGWRTGSLAGELCALVAENCFWSLDAPPIRVCSEEVPIPYPKHLEDAVTPQVEKIVNAVLGLLNKETVS